LHTIFKTIVLRLAILIGTWIAILIGRNLELKRSYYKRERVAIMKKPFQYNLFQDLNEIMLGPT